MSPKVLLAEIKQHYADKLREQQDEGKESEPIRHRRERVPWHLQCIFLAFIYIIVGRSSFVRLFVRLFVCLFVCLFVLFFVVGIIL